jgi:hypothetical protein
MSADTIEIQLTLNIMEDLFAEPASDPFNPDSRYISGIDEIVGQLRLRRHDLGKKLRLVVRLPQSTINSDTQSTLKAALDRYCTAKIIDNQQTIDELRITSGREAISAFIIVAILYLLILILVFAIPPLKAVSGMIASFTGIAVWVIFWEPINNYVYSWRPNRLDIRVFENLRTADLVVASQ